MVKDTSDKRVQLDFEIDSSNGGGIQTHEFTMCIVDDDISDRELAEHVVHDLGLLMVEDIRILNETHGRDLYKAQIGRRETADVGEDGGELRGTHAEPLGKGRGILNACGRRNPAAIGT
jgi:hypothetical protein